jgi:hypothetical protein
MPPPNGSAEPVATRLVNPLFQCCSLTSTTTPVLTLYRQDGFTKRAADAARRNDQGQGGSQGSSSSKTGGGQGGGSGGQKSGGGKK